MSKLNVEVKNISVSDDDQGKASMYWDEAYQYIDSIINNNIENQSLRFVVINKTNPNSEQRQSYTNNISMKKDSNSV